MYGSKLSKHPVRWLLGVAALFASYVFDALTANVAFDGIGAAVQPADQGLAGSV